MEEDKQDLTELEQEQLDVKDEESDQDRETEESEISAESETPGIEEKPSDGAQDVPAATGQDAEGFADPAEHIDYKQEGKNTEQTGG